MLGIADGFFFRLGQIAADALMGLGVLAALFVVAMLFDLYAARRRRK